MNAFFQRISKILSASPPEWVFFPIILIGEFMDTISEVTRVTADQTIQRML